MRLLSARRVLFSRRITKNLVRPLSLSHDLFSSAQRTPRPHKKTHKADCLCCVGSPFIYGLMSIEPIILIGGQEKLATWKVLICFEI